MTSQPPLEKQARKQGVSCDACRYRKVKCDRREKLEKRPDSTSSNDMIACSLCVGHGIVCTFTQSATRRKAFRNGRRIVAFQQGAASASTSSNSPLSTDSQRASSIGAASDAVDRDRPYLATTSRGLFDVEGLTQPLMDACFKAFVDYYAPCILSLQIEVLMARYRLYFYTLQQNNGYIEPFWKSSAVEDAYAEDRPLSEILILAVGCLGASLLQPPVVQAGSDAKFRLQDKFALKFQERLEGDLARRLQYEGTDIVEACYIMADPYLSVIGNTHGANPSPDPFRIRPATPEGITRLLTRLSINRRPKLRSDCPPGDTRIWRCSNGDNFTEMEMFRRTRIFWTVFLQNAFRSIGDKTNSTIATDDFDWELPRFVRRQDDGSYDSIIFCERERSSSLPPSRRESSSEGSKKDIVCLQSNRFFDFDVIQLQVMLRLAFVIRTVSMKLASVRSQGQSVLVSDVERAVSALSAWYQQLPLKVTWEEQVEALWKALSGSNTNGDTSHSTMTLRNALKAFFVEMLYHANVWTIWDSIETHGMRVDLDMTETVAMLADGLNIIDGSNSDSPSAVAASQVNLISSPETTASSSQSNQGQQSMQYSKQSARNKLDNLITQSFVRITKIGKEAAQLNLVRASRLVFAHVFRMYAIWGCQLAVRLSGSNIQRGSMVDDDDNGAAKSALPISLPPGCSEVDYIFKCVDDLIFALLAIDSCEQARGMSFGLKKEVQDSKAKIESHKASQAQDLGKSMHQAPFNSGFFAPENNGAIDFDALAKSLFQAGEVSNQDGQGSLELHSIEHLQRYLDQQEQQQQQQSGLETIDSEDVDIHDLFDMKSATTHLQLSSTRDHQTGQEFLDSLPFEFDNIPIAEDFSLNGSQMSHLLAYSDAQNWADAQWQSPIT